MYVEFRGIRRLASGCTLAILAMACGHGSPEEMEVSQSSTALVAAISISGRVLRQDGTAASGVTVTLAGSSQGTKTTDGTGQYLFSGLKSGSYSIRPTRAGCSFSPDVVNLNQLTASKTQNFVASGAACQSSTSPAVVKWIDAPLSLVAQRDYSTNRWQDADSTPAQPVRIKIPATLPVIVGNAGAGTATLSYWVPSGEVHCEYRGGGSVAHPTSPVQIAEAQEYKFRSCSDGAQAGAERVVSRVMLHVQEGDASDPAQFTEVRLRLGGTPTLDPPVSRAQSVALREGFLWTNTTALPEVNSEGKDALFYAQIYVESREDAEALKWLYIHHDTLPLFNAELGRWAGQSGVFSNSGDGTGAWVFAIIPAVTYNQIRQAAINGDEIFKAIVLRPPPADVRNPDGSLAYAALARNAFMYESDLSVEVPDDGAALAMAAPTAVVRTGATRSNRRFGLRSIIRGIGTAVKAVVQGVQRGMGAVDRWVNGSVKINMALDVLNLDPTFGTEQPFQRSWGAGLGNVAKLPQVRVEVRQLAPLGITTLFVGHTGDNGADSIRVGRYRDSSVCVDVENRAAIVTEFIFAKKLCSFGISAASLGNDYAANWRLANSDFNILMQASEGRAYLVDVVGHTPPRADILVGSLSDLIGKINGDRAFAPCLGFRNANFDGYISTAGALLSAVPVVGPVLSLTLAAAQQIFATSDILFPAATWYGTQSMTSRGVVTHEYGHFALCSMMDAIGPDVLANAYTEAMLAALTQDEGAVSYINEAFADFFSGQVAGGTNYFTPGGSSESQGIKFCDSASASCLDENFRSDASHNQNIARVATMIHDAFDGHVGGGNVPGNGNVWSMSQPQPPPPIPAPWAIATTAGGHLDDEQVALAGQDVFGMLRNWAYRSNSLSESSLFGGLTDSMVDAGYSWCDQCKVFALHSTDPRGQLTDRDKYDVCQIAPIASWLGTVPEPSDPASCLFGAYFRGCRNAGTSMCDELVDPAYFTRHVGCSRHRSCLGAYEECSRVTSCPIPTAAEIPNVIVKAAGVPDPSAILLIGYTWNASGTGGFHGSDVTRQPWAEMELGAGVNAPAGYAMVQCTASGNGHVLTSLSVRWNNGFTQSLPCSGMTCTDSFPVNDGFIATCNFALSP